MANDALINLGNSYRAPKSVMFCGKRIRRAHRVVVVEHYDDGMVGVDVFKRRRSQFPSAWTEIDAKRLSKLRRLGDAT